MSGADFEAMLLPPGYFRSYLCTNFDAHFITP
jgi:hypothetical protein